MKRVGWVRLARAHPAPNTDEGGPVAYPETPQSRITLKQARDEGDRVLRVTEDADTVLSVVNANQDKGLISFGRVKDGHKVAFATQPSNVLNVENL